MDASLGHVAAGDHAAATSRFAPEPVAVRTRACREQLCREHLGGGLLYLEAGQPVLRNGYDVFHPFRANSSFIYATGVNEPEFACLLDAETGSLTLLAPELPEEASFWVGGLPSLDELAEMYGADRCCYTKDLKRLLTHGAGFRGRTIHTTAALEAKLVDLLGEPRRDSLLTNAASAQRSPEQPAQADSAECAAHDRHLRHEAGLDGGAGMGGASRLQGEGTSPPPSRVIGGLLERALSRSRAVKTPGEVACLLHANAVSGQAHVELWQACRPGMYEYQLEAVFRHSTASRGCVALGYPSIVGAGRNGAILHYDSCRGRVQPGDLVLVDAGAEHQCYTADISRTFPASGAFSLAQREMYGAVLAAQEHALGTLRAGVAMSDVEEGARRVLLGHLIDMGLVKGDVESLLYKTIDRVFMPHGLSHFLGLDVHDVSGVGSVPKVLQAGNVVTVEPGLYFIEPLIQKAAASDKVQFLNVDRIESFKSLGGVRIEDNVLVEDHGIVNLTGAVPKSISEIESITCQ